ncbi:MAG: hypothetical protein AAGH40_06995 [Verrucomicrobiota bacterium]
MNKTHAPSASILPLIFGILLLANNITALESAFILNDDFQDGDRTLQKPPESLQYFYSGNPRSIKETEGNLVLNGDQRAYLLGYLGAPGEYIELEVGQILSLEITFRAEQGEGQGLRPLRLALLNSGDNEGGQRATMKDHFGSKMVGHTDYRGYQAAYALFASTGNTIAIYERDLPHQSLIISTLEGKSGYTPLGEFGGSGSTRADSLYTAQIYVQRQSETETEITAILAEKGSKERTDFSLKRLDTNDIVTRFDTIGVGLKASKGNLGNVYIESLRVFKVM